MSKFLGPIHYWLYDKIGNQESLTAAIAEDAQKNGWIDSAEPYVKELPPLESVIDESNIHGWLQSQITDAETRYAKLITTLKASKDFDLDKVLNTAFAFGQKHAVSSDADTMDAYKAFEDFFVNGMPCDQVNALVSQSPDELVWEMTQDIHASYWGSEGSESYYVIRKSVMDGMLEGSRLSVTMNNLYQYTLKSASY